MTDFQSSMTVLTCADRGKKATKVFSVEADGSIKKRAYSAGTLFSHETKTFSSLRQWAEILDDLLDEPSKFAIRGQIKEAMPKIVRRKTHEPYAAFDAVPRPYVVLDIDKQPCPDYFDPINRPEEIVAWVQGMLPEPFQNISCYYKFSSSQNVYMQERGGKTVSIHLHYLCDRAVSDDEWKRYFRMQPAPVDQALFSAVQIHYTAKPIFDNMEDPLPRRSGIFQGVNDFVPVPPIPPAPTSARSERPEQEPIISDDDKDKALALLVPHYIDGKRNRFCSAIAATLYRGGWRDENAASFVHQLAEMCSDSEANSRYDNAFRICDAVDRNQPAPGIPVLKNEFNIEDIELDRILSLLGVGKPDIDQAISSLNKQSQIPEIKAVLKMILFFSEGQRAFYIDKIVEQISCKKGSIKILFEEVKSEEEQRVSCDQSDQLMEDFLQAEYRSGEHLLYTTDRAFWEYTGRFWQPIPEQQIKKALLPHARHLITEQERGSVSKYNADVMNILEGRVYRKDNPLRRLDQDPLPVINCLNGEVWFDEKGNATLKPHRPDSYLRHCLNVEYDPSAKSPMFDKAVLEIFSNSSDPDGMLRHFIELAGYICQPWRKLAVIVLLHGGGSNGKTSLMKIVRRLLGENTVMSDRISDIEGNVFKIGDLDGKLMLLDDDVDGGTCLPDGFLKKISEEKAMTGQHKHKPPFEFISRTVPVMLANDYPVTSDLTRGLRRRLLTIPFTRTFEPHEINTALFDDIWAAEASGILNHVVAGFGRLKQRGRFDEPMDCVGAKKEWIIRANVLTTFIDEMCIEGDEHRIPVRDLWEAFNSYCRDTGVRNVQSLKGVRGRLEGLGYRIGTLDGKRVVWGLKLRAAEFGGVAHPNL